jgi:hypothetical protein
VIVGGILAHEVYDVFAEPRHVLGKCEAQMTKTVHLSKNDMTCNLGVEPFNIGGISESISVALNESNWNLEIF